MMEVSLADIARALGAESLDGTRVTGVSVDTRTLVPGDIFFAVPGARVDPHDVVDQAVTAGASALVVQRPVPAASIPTITVENTMEALGKLAHWYWSERLSCTTIAITGSSGKTTTKDMIAQILSSAAPTVSPQGSFNTEIGVPLTILAADDHTRFLVLEMGMRGLGHISYLTGIATPDIAVVTNVGHAHVGVLGGIDQIALAKGELVEGVNRMGVALLNADDPRVRGMGSRTEARIVTYGRSPEADITAHGVVIGPSGVTFEVTQRRTGLTTSLPIDYVGEHNVSNALAAIAVGLECGLTLEAAATALAHARPRSAMRMEVHTGKQGITIINDAYNANPESMKAAIDSLAAWQGRRWAILGEMRELGDRSQDLHADVGRYVAAQGIERLVCIGEGTRPLHVSATERGVDSLWLPDADDALQTLRTNLRSGDIALVKASRSVGLDRIVTELLMDQGGEAG